MVVSALLFAGLLFSTQAQDSIRFAISRDTVVAGVRCGPTGRSRASAYPNGRLASCPVARDTMIGVLLVHAGTWVTFTDSGAVKLMWLNRPRVIQGVPCRGDGYKTWSTDLYPDGRLRACFLSREAIIDGVPCRSAWFWSEIRRATNAFLRPNGKLESCVLSADLERNGVKLHKNDRVYLDSTGAITPRSRP